MRYGILAGGVVVGVATGDASGLLLPDEVGLGWRADGDKWLPPLPPEAIKLTRDQVEASRLRAYADPITGSDRYFAEAQRESLLGNAEAADAAKALGMARFAAIQAEYPWPAE